MPHYDYSQGGVYFCTLCVHHTHRHKNLLAKVENGIARLNRFGAIVESCWFDVPNHRPYVQLDDSVVMPNHAHLVLIVDAPLQNKDYVARFGPQPADSLATIVGAFKAAVTRDIRALRGEETHVWQPRFHDRVVRSEEELIRIRRYIELNPANWQQDRCHPQHPDFESVWQGRDPDGDL